MPLPEPVRYLIARARRRLLMMDLTRRLITVTAVVAVLAAAVIGIARYVAAPWVEPAALGVLVAGWLAALGWSLWRRPTAARAAIEADQRMRGFDRISTALELTGKPELSEPEDRQIREAGAWATNRPLSGFDRLLPAGPLVPLAGLGVAAALVLALVPSPADAVVEQRKIEEALIEEIAETLEEQADQLTPELQEQLEALIEELRDAEDLDAAAARLSEARTELARQADPSLLARKTTMAALDREIDREALAAGSDLIEQLQQLAAAAGSLTAEQAAAAAARLDELAATAEADGTLAEQLAMAADALEAGRDPSFHLDAAVDALSDAQAQIADGEATAAAQTALRDALDALAGAQGQGQGQGQGQSGQGLGQGQGGQGQGGQGQGQVSGGNVSGGGGSGTPGQGGTGTGTVTPGQGDDDPFAPVGRADVFDPVDFDLGDEVRVDLEGVDPGQVVGESRGFGLRNLPTLSYADRHAEYTSRALDALDHMTIPRDLQDIVRDYFTKLEP